VSENEAAGTDADDGGEVEVDDEDVVAAGGAESGLDKSDSHKRFQAEACADEVRIRQKAFQAKRNFPMIKNLGE